MRCLRTFCPVGVLVLLLICTAAADDAGDLYSEIKKAGDVKIDREGKSHEEYRAETIKHLSTIIDKCEQYKKRYPDGADIAAVHYEQARAYYYLSRFKQPRRELLTKGVKLAHEVIALDPRSEAAGKSRGLLIQYYKMTGKWKEMIEQAEAILRDFPDSDFAPLALSYVGDAYERMGEKDKAFAAYKRLVEEYKDAGDNDYVLRAAGILRFRDLKGTVMELEFTSTAEKAIQMKDYRGKVVVVDFWASWHRPCHTSMPVLVRIEELLRDKGLRVIGISLDADKDQMEAFVKKMNMTWPQYFDGKKWRNKLARHYGIRAIPARIVVDKTGKVREVNPDDATLKQAIRKLLDEPAP